MKRTLLIAFMAIVAMTSMALATETRVKTMGQVGNFVYDDANIFDWPSTVVGFSDRFILELGEDAVANDTYDPMDGNTWPNGFGGGAVFNIGEVHNLGFYVNGNDRANGGGIDVDVPGLDMNIDEFMQVLYGYGAENFDVGFNVNYGKSRDEQTAPSDAATKESASRIGAKGGITYWMEDDNSVDLAVEFNKTSITYDDQTTQAVEIEDDGYRTISAQARMFYNYTENLQFVPYVGFMKADWGVKQDSDANGEIASDKVESTAIDIALGINHFPTEQLQLIAAAGVVIYNEDYTSQGEDAGSAGMNQIPYIKGGIDSELRSWLDIRAGVEKQLYKDDSKGAGDAPVEMEYAVADFQGYIGAGFHLGDWTVDAQLDPALFYEGPNFISGHTDTANMATRISLVRPW